MKTREVFDCYAIEEGLDFIERKMKDLKIQKQVYNQNRLVSEEILTKIMEVANPSCIRIRTGKNFGESSIRFVFSCEKPFELLNEEDETDISGRILSYYAERIRTKYKNGTMTITLLAQQSYTRYARMSVIAALLAIVSAYLITEFAPQTMCNFLETRVIWVIESIFIKAICLIATPVTFFCIAANIATYSNMADRYPYVNKLVLRYVFTSVVAVIIGYLIYGVTHPLFHGLVFPEYQLKGASMLDVSDIWLAISAMVPENILDPFISSATLPIFILALIFGVAVAAIDRQSGQLKEGVDAIRSLFCKMLSVVFHFSPLMIFLCIFELILYHGFAALYYQALLIIAVILCCFVTSLSYAIPLSLSRINPARLLHKIWRSFWNVFLIGSTEDAIPDTIRDCSEKLNFPKRPLEVSIPLGAELNMDGNCAVLMLLMMTFSQIAGVQMSMQTIILLGIIILTISFGAPNQPGSIAVGAMIILPQIGLSNEMVTAALIVEIATSRFLATSNVIGDIVCTELVGEKERRSMEKVRKENSAFNTK